MQKIEIGIQAGHACVPVNNLQWTKLEGDMTEDEPDLLDAHYNSSLFHLRLPHDDVSCSLRAPFIKGSTQRAGQSALVVYVYASTSFALFYSLSSS